MTGRRARRGRRWVRALAWLGTAALFAALAIPVAVGVLLASRSGTRPRDLALTGTPADYGLSYRSVFITTGDGLRLSGWLLPAPDPAGCSVVMAHGLFRSRQELLERGAWLARRGCRALLLDLRRHGGSAGGRTTLGFHERFDVMAGAAFLRREFPEDRLFLYGVSMGAAAAAGAGASDPTPPAGVVLDSVFRSASAVVDRYARLFFGLPPFPAGDLTLAGMRLAAGFRPREMDVEALSRRLGERGVPVLVIAGDADLRAPAEGQHAVFRANGQPRSRMVTVEGATHGRPCLAAPAVCQEALQEFFDLGGRRFEPRSVRRLFYDPER